MKRWLSLVLAFSLLTAVVPAASAQACLVEYTVKVGDTLSVIAQRELGTTQKCRTSGSSTPTAWRTRISFTRSLYC